MASLIIANWKMNPKTAKEAKKIFFGIASGFRKIKKAQAVICPPPAFLSLFIGKAKKVKLGAQNCHWEEKGAFTGEMSLAQIKDIGCRYVLAGHSERRKLFGETDEMINKKVLAALQIGLIPVLCMGETAEEKEGEMTFRILKEQLEKGLNGVAKKAADKVILAYEPVWAIGTGKVCGASQAEEVNIFLKKALTEKYGRKIADSISILYGGSVKSDNVLSFVKDAKMSGVLVGGASLDPKEFIKIVQAADF
ncbi:MAG: triose-phosphate isomerase [Candidatus Paceibacterota bacterium]|jgi:triosephosphate isomerase